MTNETTKTTGHPDQATPELPARPGQSLEAAREITAAEEDLSDRIDEWVARYPGRTFAELIGVLEMTKARLMQELQRHLKGN